MPPSSPIRVLIIEDSAIIRRMLSQALAGDPEITVVGTAANGKLGLEAIEKLQPDLITLDVEMPEMDGLAMLGHLRKTNRRIPVIMVSSLKARGGAATLDALSKGASDYITKPSNTSGPTEAIAYLRKELIPRMKTLCGRVSRPTATPSAAARSALSQRPSLGARPLLSSRSLSALPTSAPGVKADAPAGGAPAPRASTWSAKTDIVAIASSTGGPNALEMVLTALPANFPVPIVIVQHMPPMFTKLLADRLDTKCAVSVVEATVGMRVEPGRVYIAPGGHHMEIVEKNGTYIVLNQGPPENSCRPAADVLFRSVARSYGARGLGVVLTGMGYDGQKGSDAMVAAGATIIAQDEATSVVWGMPGAVVSAGLANEIVPLEQVSASILKIVMRWPGMRVAAPRGSPPAPAAAAPMRRTGALR